MKKYFLILISSCLYNIGLSQTESLKVDSLHVKKITQLKSEMYENNEPKSSKENLSELKIIYTDEEKIKVIPK